MIKRFFRSFIDGMAIIGEGMGSLLSIYPTSPARVPKFRKRSCKDDAKNLAGDWKKVIDPSIGAWQDGEYDADDVEED